MILARVAVAVALCGALPALANRPPPTDAEVQQFMAQDRAAERAKAEQERRDDASYAAQMQAIERAKQDRMAENRQREREAADRASDEYTRLDRLPLTHEQAIREMKSHLADLQRRIARERRIGATAGFVNGRTLYNAAQAIEQVRDQIGVEYRRYRETGGRKPLSAI